MLTTRLPRLVALALVAVVGGALVWVALPRNGGAIAMSRALARAGQRPLADCERLTSTSAASPRLAQWQATCLLSQGNLQAAGQIFEDLVQRDRDDTMAYALLSRTYEQRGQPEAFLDVLNLWKSLGTAETWKRGGAAAQLLRVGLKAYRAGERHQAALALRAAWKLAPGDPAIAYYLSYAERDIDDWLAALYPVWQAYHATGGRDTMRVELKKIVNLDQTEAEVRRLQGQVRSTPGDASAHIRLGWALFLAGRPLDEALEATRQGVDLAPRDATGHAQMGDLLRYGGREQEAVPWYERAIELASPPPVSAVAGLGLARYYTGEFDLAARWLARAVSLAPDRRGLWDVLAASYRFGGQCSPAIAAARRVVSTSGNLGHDLSLGQLYESCGLRQEAVDTYRGILAKDPTQRLRHQLAREALVRLQ